MLTSLDVVTVAVRDLGSAIDCYARLLGHNPTERESIPERGLDVAHFELANTRFQLLTVSGKGPFTAGIEAWLEKHGEGVFALGFETDDAAACAAELRARGLEARDPLDPHEARGPTHDRRTVIVPPSATRGTVLTAVQHTGLDGAEQVAVAPAVDPAAPPEACLIGIDHVVVASADVEASRALYEDGLGLRLALDRSFESRGLRILFFRIGGVTIEVAGSLTQLPSGDRDDRFDGIAWQVRDVAAARERLLRQGFDVSEHREGFKPGTRVCTVRGDTCGVPTLLIGPDLA